MRRKSFVRIIIGMSALVSMTLVLCGSVCAQSTYKTLYRFKGGKDGSGPGAGLTFDSVGNLYSTTERGGAFGYGTVFELTPTANGGWKKSLLHSFKGGDGSTPLSATLIFDSTGNLYGTTNAGGAHGIGTVFELSPNGSGGWKETVLHSFKGTDGSEPIGTLLFDSVGNLYGTTTWGGAHSDGTVFELSPNGDGTWKETVLYSFTGGSDGLGITGGLAFDALGNLYGIAGLGGTGGSGTVFELSQNADGTWTESTLHAFEGTDGASPWWGVVFDQNGNLYSSTFNGGAHGGGTVYQLTPNGDGTWKENVLYSPRISGPAAVTVDAGGNVYSTNVNDFGNYNNIYGTVFKVSPVNGGWKETTVHTFRNHPGALPYAGVIFDAAGNLYSTTYGDGTKTFGSVFEITP